MTREELARLAFEASPTAAVVVESDGRIVLANAAAETLLGVGPGEWQEMAAAAALPWLDLGPLDPGQLPGPSREGGLWRHSEVRGRGRTTLSIDAAVVNLPCDPSPLRVAWMVPRPVPSPWLDGAGDSLAFERLLADIAAGFVNVAIDKVDERIRSRWTCG